ncbi:MAG: METTL5 family protein [Methanomicrobiales archaeon]|nr:METTL5 family protein [Methanomicrobiales archaeon]
MKLRTLERELERLCTVAGPEVRLEQYHTPPSVAARLLFHAALRGDITDEKVCDLGCGAGILACGAALLGAAQVRGIDIDPRSIDVARANAKTAGVEVEFLVAGIADETAFEGYTCDTVVMNPPFGAQRRHADRPFIDRALGIGGVVYGIFNSGSLPFVRAYIGDRGFIEEAVSGRFPLPRMFAFHTRDRVEIEVEILCIRKR